MTLLSLSIFLILFVVLGKFLFKTMFIAGVLLITLYVFSSTETRSTLDEISINSSNFILEYSGYSINKMKEQSKFLETQIKNTDYVKEQGEKGFLDQFTNSYIN